MTGNETGFDSGSSATVMEDGWNADIPVELVSAVRSSTTKHQYFAKSLQIIARSFGSPYAAIYINFGSGEFEDDCHWGPTDPGFWKPPLQEFLTEALTRKQPWARVLNPKRGRVKAVFLSVPVYDAANRTIGAMALVQVGFGTDDVQGRLASLESLSRLVAQATELLIQPRAAATTPGGSAQALVQSASASTAEELAFAITNNLRNKFDCELVALGMVHRRKVKVLSLSGLDQVPQRNPGVACIQAAMEECLDAGLPIVCQKGDTWTSERSTAGYGLHRQWQVSVKGDAVASIPLRNHDRTAAVLSLRRRATEPFTDQQIKEIQSKVEPYIAALLTVDKAGRSLFRHAGESLYQQVSLFSQPGHRGRKYASVMMVAAAVWFFFGTLEYRLNVPCLVIPAHSRHVTAPFVGILEKAEVVQGDRVRRGQVLCQMDTRGLVQERAELLAEIAVHEHDLNRALADREPVEAQLATAKQKLAQTRLEIANRKIEEATMRAPFDGVVIVGDLRRQIGSTIERGTSLLEIAPSSSWALELQVPEVEAEELIGGLSGTFALKARPEYTQTFSITRVHLKAQAQGRKNIYLAEGNTQAGPPWMRPGMEGLAKISIGRRPVWWITLHRAIDYCRMALWF